jgi:hypothetical protein
MSRLHASLRLGTNVVMLVLWLGMIVGLFVVSRGATAVLSLPAVVLGVAGGLMQARALHDNRAAFRRAQTAIDVRGALRDASWGARYLLYFWATMATFGAAALLLPAQIASLQDSRLLLGVVVLLALYSAFAFGRDVVTMPALGRLARDD